MKAEISIVIPIYNAEKTLRRCIDSAVNQTYRDIEIILVDDRRLYGQLREDLRRICGKRCENPRNTQTKRRCLRCEKYRNPSRHDYLADFCGERRLSYAGCLRDDASRGRKTSGGSGHGSLL